MFKHVGSPTQVARNIINHPTYFVTLLVAALAIQLLQIPIYSGTYHVSALLVWPQLVGSLGYLFSLYLYYRKKPESALALYIVIFSLARIYYPILIGRSVWELIAGMVFAIYLIRFLYGRAAFRVALLGNMLALLLLYIAEQRGYDLFYSQTVVNTFQYGLQALLWFGYAGLVMYVLHSTIMEELSDHVQLSQQMRHNAMIVQNVSDAIVSCALPDYKITSWNRAAQEIYGWSKAEVIGKRSRDVFRTHVTLQEYDGIIEHIIQHGNWIGELHETHKDGRDIFVRVSFSMLRDEEGEPISLVGVSQDITMQKLAERALERRNAILGAVHFAAERFLESHDWQEHIGELLQRLGAATGALRVCLYEDRVEPNNVRWSRECCVWLPHVESPELSQEELSYDNLGLAHWRMAFEEGRPLAIKMSTATPSERAYMDAVGVTCKLGVPIFVDHKLYGSLCLGQMEEQSPWQPIELEALSIAANIIGAAIERQSALRALLQKQKLEEIGLLAGGIAHDFNNLLTGILSQNSLVERKLEPNHKALKHVYRVQTAAQRASDLTQKLLAYAGKGHFVFEEVNLNALILETVDLIDGSLRKTGALELTLAPTLPALWADSSQLQQVVSNLIINALEATGGIQTQNVNSATGHDAQWPDRARPKVVVETYMRTVSTQQLDNLDEYIGSEQWKPGPYVGVKVRDYGIGMDAGTANQIFTPFYSTKGSGRGLGLAASLGVVRALGGGIRVESQPGAGTAFQVLIPCHTPPAGDSSEWTEQQMGNEVSSIGTSAAQPKGAK